MGNVIRLKQTPVFDNGKSVRPTTAAYWHVLHLQLLPHVHEDLLPPQLQLVLEAQLVQVQFWQAQALAAQVQALLAEELQGQSEAKIAHWVGRRKVRMCNEIEPQVHWNRKTENIFISEGAAAEKLRTKAWKTMTRSPLPSNLNPISILCRGEGRNTPFPLNPDDLGEFGFVDPAPRPRPFARGGDWPRAGLDAAIRDPSSEAALLTEPAAASLPR
ncbi:uncharacterized protein VTP21DRAFT_11174 [Calcarisporiella thermophila]|uniref:uncharacterized protein n=1 Tax=Calcarisporiella thermophila TaxID=911321 RepID=UPI0037431B87